MGQNHLMLTETGLKKLQDELEVLVKVRRKEVAHKIKEAKEQGDLSENAEYAAAKEEQGNIEARIAELEHAIKTAEVTTAHTGKKDVVTLSSTVVVDIDGKSAEFAIVGTNEADPASYKISNESPLGQALMGQKSGATVTYKTPDGSHTCTIKKIS
jgi:transcription elongation factor GreA